MYRRKRYFCSLREGQTMQDLDMDRVISLKYNLKKYVLVLCIKSISFWVGTTRSVP